MLGLPITFAAPLVLTALAALPAIWLLLRVTPPQPRRLDFPPLRILADLLPERETPARTPWWLLLLRLTLAALLILAAAGPIWNPLAGDGGKGPLLVVMDNGFAAAHDWRERLAIATEQVEGAGRESRIVAVVGTADRPAEIEAASPGAALERLRTFRPAPHLPDRSAHLDSIVRFLTAQPGAEVAWITDGVSGVDAQTFIEGLAPMTADRRVTVYKADRASALALAGAENAAGQLTVHLVRPEPNGRDTGIVRALDLKNLPLADVKFAFDPQATTTDVRFELPVEVRNSIARIEILGESSAGAVTLLDDRGKRRRVGLVFGGTADQSQPLLSPTYYIERALAPYAELRQGRGGVAEAVGHLLDEQVSVLVLADVGALDRDTLAKVTAFVERAGFSCASPARASRRGTTTSCRSACAGAGAASAAPSPGTRPRPLHPSRARARSSAFRFRPRSASIARSSPNPTPISPRKPGRRSKTARLSSRPTSGARDFSSCST
jgi:hypothetical protein